MFEYVLLPLFLGLAVPTFITIAIVKFIKSKKSGEIIPLNERWGSLCKWISLAFGGLHFILFWSLQTLLMGDTSGGVTGLYSEDIKEIEQQLLYCFLCNAGMLISMIVCLKIGKHENENKNNYRPEYFEKKKNAEYQANGCIITFVISVIGYVWNLLEYAQYS